MATNDILKNLTPDGRQALKSIMKRSDLTEEDLQYLTTPDIEILNQGTIGMQGGFLGALTSKLRDSEGYKSVVGGLKERAAAAVENENATRQAKLRQSAGTARAQLNPENAPTEAGPDYGYNMGRPVEEAPVSSIGLTPNDYTNDAFNSWVGGQAAPTPETEEVALPQYGSDSFGGLGDSVNRLLEANGDRFKGKSADMIRTGETLKIPDGKGGFTDHVVKQGETVSQLAGYRVADKKKAQPIVATPTGPTEEEVNAAFNAQYKRLPRRGEMGYQMGGRFISDNDPTQQSALNAARRRIEENWTSGA